jgi:outer membrane receptor for ferrienterochelin and colicin
MIAVVSIPNDARGLLFTYDNLENAYTMGIESSASLKIRDELSCLLSYAWLDTWDGENNRPLAGRPRHRFAGNVRYQHPATELEFVVRAAVSLGRQYYVPESDTSSVERTVNTKPLAQADVRVAKHFGRLLELFIGIDNLFDAGDAYATIRPRTVYGGARGRY